MAEAKRSQKRVNDVTHPDKTAPTPSSKPVLVTNRPMLKDPMVVDDSPLSADLETAPLLRANGKKSTSKSKPSSEKVLTPPETVSHDAEPDDKSTEPEVMRDSGKDQPHATESAEKAEVTAGLSVDHIEKPEKTIAELAAEGKQKADQSAENSVETSSDTDDADGGVVKQPADKTDPALEQAEQEQHDAGVQKLIDGKQYFLPINAVEKRRTKRVVLLGVVLSLVLALVWVDVALDASLIKVSGLKPLTHFFSN